MRKFSPRLLALARKRTEEIRLELEFWSHLLRDEQADRSGDPPPDLDPPNSAGSRKRGASREA